MVPRFECSEWTLSDHGSHILRGERYMVASWWSILENLGLIIYLTTGDVIHSCLLGIDMIVINSDAIARELLNKRSATYSDCPIIHTTELYVLLVIIIFSDIDRLARQVWTVFQYWTPSVW